MFSTCVRMSLKLGSSIMTAFGIHHMCTGMPGGTKWSFRKLFGCAIEGIVNFSGALLNLMTGMGMMITAASFFWMLILIAKKIYDADYNVSGWTSTICVILFLGGI